jgi:hypothetical protein
MDLLLTYMALQPRFGQGLSEKIPPLYSISSAVCPVTGPKIPAIVVHAIRPPEFRSFPWFRLLSGTALKKALYSRSSHLLSCAQRSAIYCSSRRHGAPMTFRLLNSISSLKLLLLYTPSILFLGHISCGEPFKDE